MSNQSCASVERLLEDQEMLHPCQTLENLLYSVVHSLKGNV